MASQDHLDSAFTVVDSIKLMAPSLSSKIKLVVRSTRDRLEIDDKAPNYRVLVDERLKHVARLRRSDHAYVKSHLGNDSLKMLLMEQNLGN